MNVAYWGSGPISHFHVPALKECGANITTCFSRPASERLEKFGRFHNIEVSKDEDDFLKSCHNVEAVFVALKTENTVEALKKLKGSYKIFFEKPGSLNSSDLMSLQESVNVKNFFSLYNRRFYSTVEYVKNFIEHSTKPVNLNVYFPDTKKGVHQFFINGCHAVDLSLYLLDDFSPEILGVVGDLSNQSAGFSFICESKKGHILNFNNPWGAPSRARLDCYNSLESLQLMPFEALEASNEMKVVEPTDDVPIRRYIPNSYYRDFVSSSFKPGFVEQAKSALNYTSKGIFDKRICTFDQAVKVVTFIENVLGRLK